MKKLLCFLTVFLLTLSLPSCINEKKGVTLLQEQDNIQAIEIYDIGSWYTEGNIHMLRERETPAATLREEEYPAFSEKISALVFEEEKVLLPIVMDGGCDYDGYVIAVVYADGSYDVIAQRGLYSYAVDAYGRGRHKYDHADYCGETPWSELFGSYVGSAQKPSSEHGDVGEAVGAVTEETTLPVQEETTPEAAALALLQSVLLNETPIQDDKNGEMLLCQYHYYGEYLDLNTAEFALVDMNGDGIMEAIVQDVGDVVMLYCYEEQVFAEYYRHRSMYEISEDGTYCWTYANHWGYLHGESKLEFHEGKWKAEVIWRREESYENEYQEADLHFWLFDEEVTEDELNAYLQKRPFNEVTFVPLTEENVCDTFS